MKLNREQQNDLIIDFFMSLGAEQYTENKVNDKKAELINLVYELMNMIPKEHIAYEKILEVNELIEDYDLLVKKEYIEYGRVLETLEREK